MTLSTRVDIESSYDELLDQIPVVLSETAVATDDAGHLQAINDLFRRMMQVRPEHRCTAMR